MPMYSDRRPCNNLATQRSAKRGPPPRVARGGLLEEAHRTASRIWHGQPARAAIRSLPVNLLQQSRWINLASSRSDLTPL